MRALLDRLSGPLHVGLASMSVFLVGASPWLHMYRSLPRQASFFNLSHVVLGVLVLVLVLVYSVGCCRGGRWRLYFPWLAGQWSAVGRDLGGIARGRLPGVEGGGLFAMIEGLLLLALLGYWRHWGGLALGAGHRHRDNPVRRARPAGAELRRLDAAASGDGVAAPGGFHPRLKRVLPPSKVWGAAKRGKVVTSTPSLKDCP
jgi:hypothetical protein